MRTRILLVLAGMCAAHAGVVPVTWQAATQSTVTFSGGTIPTYTETTTGLNSSAELVDKYYPVPLLPPGIGTVMLNMNGWAQINCTSTAAKTALASTLSVESEPSVPFLYNFSGKALSRTSITNGLIKIGTSASCPAGTTVMLDFAFVFSHFGTPTSYDWDFQFMYDGYVFIDRDWMESHNNQAMCSVQAGSSYYFNFWHEAYTWARPLDTSFQMQLGTRYVPEPATVMLLALGAWWIGKHNFGKERGR